jgi:uncharacterized protein (TIGR02271 family)
MNEQTLVAVYDTADQANAAGRDLKAANVPAHAISQHAKNGFASGATSTETEAPVREKGFWASLFGGEPDYDTSVYDRSIDSGSTVVTVRVPGEQFDRISEILENHDPVDLDERTARYGSTETTTTRTTAPASNPQATATEATEGDTIQLAEETLSVGKRAVNGGTTRIRRHVVETPVEEQVTLHTEKVTMERRPVTDGRSVGDAAFTDKTVEMTEISEEAVVSKAARVTEEVSLRKEASDRVETVKDTVRRDEVDVEQVPGEPTGASRRAAGGASGSPTNPAQHGTKI